MYRLFLGNQNYSSWSLRPWLVLRHFDIPFEAHWVNVLGKGAFAARGVHRDYSDSGLVPCLHDGDLHIWDSLAICEYLAEKHPQLWPQAAAVRARARSVACEMHAGFQAVRGAMPMNIKCRFNGRPLSEELQYEIDRIATIWIECRRQFASAAKPWLFGDFSIADAMFAPLAWRFETYPVTLSAEAEDYRQQLLSHPAMQVWQSGALAETVCIDHYDALAEAWGGGRPG